jgi:hypothetical protein
MISDVPLLSIDLASLEQLKRDGVRENRRLDFKQSLKLAERDDRVAFLQDVVAMANADGGTILFGVEEGEGDEKGVAVGLPGIAINRDQISNAIDSLLRDNTEERITVHQHDVRLDSGNYIYIVRVPPSALAPHMIANIKTSAPRFYIRANASNEPMTVQQIKDSSLRHGNAIEGATERIERRVGILRERAKLRKGYQNEELPPNQSVLHVVPLFPHPGGWNYADKKVNERLMRVQPHGRWGQEFGDIRFTQHGAFREYRPQSHTGFLRDGSLEGQEFDVISRQNAGARIIVGSDVVESTDIGLELAETLSTEGLLPTPVLVQLHLLDVQGATFVKTRHFGFGSDVRLEDNDIQTEAFVIADWTERLRVLRQLMDHVWQAFGIASCDQFEIDGRRMLFDRNGYRVPREQ